MTTLGAGQPALSADQKAVLEAIFQTAWSSGNWPKFGILDRPLRRSDVNAQTVLQGLVPQYVHRDSWGPVVQPDESLRLTVRGVNEVSGRDSVIPVFLQVLGFLVLKESSYDPTPTTTQMEPTVSEAEVTVFLTKDRPPDQAKKLASRLGLLIWEESANWRSGITMSPDGQWTVTLSSQIQCYEGVDNIQDYFAKSPQYAVEQPLTNASLEDELVAQSEDESAAPPTHVRKFSNFLGRWTEQIVIGVIVVVIGGLLLLFITNR